LNRIAKVIRFFVALDLRRFKNFANLSIHIQT
jgi:hypothetical protein